MPTARSERRLWPWVFALIFVGLTSSAAYFATRPVPLARRMDADRSSLRTGPDGQGLALVVVLGVPRDGEVRALPRAPTKPDERWRIDVQWTAEPGARVDSPRGERTFEVPLPANVDEVEVWDLRGGLAPERMVLTRVADGG